MAYSPFLFRSFLFGGYKNICESVTQLKGANVLGSMVCIKYTLRNVHIGTRKKIHYLWTYFLETLNVYGNIL